MTTPDVVELTERLVSFDTVSRNTNAGLHEYLVPLMRDLGFEVEPLTYQDDTGTRKDSLVARKGSGSGGLAFLSHSDTVPGEAWTRDPWRPQREADRLVGLGSCDMKGPLAATIVAAARMDESKLARPVFIVVAADEEISSGGARQVGEESRLFRNNGPTEGVIAEPTMMQPVYSHKGGARVFVTARGTAAHTSTDRGVSSNFKIAPFLARMPALAQRFKTEPQFQDQQFDPPTLGFNMVLDDGGCRPNVCPPVTVATLSFRPMPGVDSDAVTAAITAEAADFDLELDTMVGTAFYSDPKSPIVQAAVRASSATVPATVPFGTDAHTFKKYLQLVVMGPGSITQAHTDGEWIALEQLHLAVDVYSAMMVQG